mgnify:CR=1 FL=1
MIQKLAWVFGIVFLVVGVLGFVPGVTTPDGHLLGVLEVDMLHNIIHILSGVLAIGAAWAASGYARLYFQVFGIVYALVTITGFFTGGSIFGLFMVNMADNLLHLVIAAVALYAGFLLKESTSSMGGGMPSQSM